MTLKARRMKNREIARNGRFIIRISVSLFLGDSQSKVADRSQSVGDAA
jgi:hypothetical protein